MSKIKTVPTGKEWGPNDDFDWSLYEDGYNGGSHLVPNKKVSGKIIKKDVTYTYEIKKGTKKFLETYK